MKASTRNAAPKTINKNGVIWNKNAKASLAIKKIPTVKANAPPIPKGLNNDLSLTKEITIKATPAAIRPIPIVIDKKLIATDLETQKRTPKTSNTHASTIHKTLSFFIN